MILCIEPFTFVISSPLSFNEAGLLLPTTVCSNGAIVFCPERIHDGRLNDATAGFSVTKES